MCITNVYTNYLWHVFLWRDIFIKVVCFKIYWYQSFENVNFSLGTIYLVTLSLSDALIDANLGYSKLIYLELINAAFKLS